MGRTIKSTVLRQRKALDTRQVLVAAHDILGRQVGLADADDVQAVQGRLALDRDRVAGELEAVVLDDGLEMLADLGARPGAADLAGDLGGLQRLLRASAHFALDPPEGLLAGGQQVLALVPAAGGLGTSAALLLFAGRWDRRA